MPEIETNKTRERQQWIEDTCIGFSMLVDTTGMPTEDIIPFAEMVVNRLADTAENHAQGRDDWDYEVLGEMQ